MATLPFQPFSIHGQAFILLSRRTDNLICALNIQDDKRKKALLLHYCGEETSDMYDSFSNDRKGLGATQTVQDADGGRLTNIQARKNFQGSMENHAHPQL
ncbi:hypothetical protein DPMN_062271 [Dreissena polymorpha]|uniref:Uncharacterized protein n=1 Tax=Dreissena polymorpha TaxID=45954 RepID=A0A9D4HK24_DREPO|nr:hypothetical protein DPMN_062271 [Dreissena polymorpha]